MSSVINTFDSDLWLSDGSMAPPPAQPPHNIHVKNYFYRIEFYLKCSQITDCESNEHWKCFGTMEFLPAWNPPSRCLMVLHIVAAK